MSWAIDERTYSQRRACALVGIEPMTYRHKARRPDNGVLRTRLKELAQADYNQQRSHTSLGGLTPNEFAARSATGP